MTELDEKGIVFLDNRNQPYACKMWGGNPWLFYWHPDNHWVSLREVNQSEIWSFPKNLTQAEQDIYHKKHDEFNKS